MITKEAKQRLKILRFWRQYGLEATIEAFGAKRSTLFGWWKLYRESDYKEDSLNLGSQVRKNLNQRKIHPQILKEIRRLRLEVCPNIGKAKIKKYLDIYCRENNLEIYSESKIGIIIKEKKIYHHRQKIYHNEQIKIINRNRAKKRKPKGFIANSPGDLIEIDTIVKFVQGMKYY